MDTVGGIIGIVANLAPWYEYPRARLWNCSDTGSDALAFHAAWPDYRPTPLAEAPGLAEELGVARVFVKDESARMGLPAFKVLGASWAVFRSLIERVGGAAPSTLEELALRLRPMSPVELVAATDGNHGRAVAHVAGLLGLACRVFLPHVADSSVVTAIREEGAVVTVVEGPYDEAVRRAADLAQRAGPGALLVQDTAWHGYQEVPALVVEGYSTLFREIDEQLGGGVGERGLVAVPVGVGSLAQAAIAHYRRDTLVRRPALLAVEPDTAACVLASLTAGELKTVPTAHTVMTGLNCGTPSSLAWPQLRNGLNAALAVSDDEALQAVADLETVGVTTGPSGAASLAGARAALTGEGSEERRAGMGVDGTATVVLLCTEGRTAYPAKG